MLDSNEKILNSIENIRAQINDSKVKMEKSNKYSILSFILAGVFIIICIILISLYFTKVNSNRLTLIFSIISLVIGFIFLQIALVLLLLVKYFYKNKLNALINATNLIKKEINKE